MKQYVLVNMNCGKIELLRVGSNIIGRSAIPITDGVSFISLESPRAAVSRMQAVIEVAKNGDAWLRDCNSTNGTFAAVGGGIGIRLEPERFYQLKPGTRITFGDVEVLFDYNSPSPIDTQIRKNGIPHPTPCSPITTCTTTPIGVSNELLHGSGGVSPIAPSKIISSTITENVAEELMKEGPTPRTSKSRTTAEENKRIDLSDKLHADASSGGNESVPYLEESITTRKKRGRSCDDKTTPRKVVSSSLASSPPPVPPTLHYSNSSSSAAAAVPAVAESRRVTARVTPSLSPRLACFSGMDGTERADAQKLARRLGWRVAEDILDADVLVVGRPVARTPKFLIAVGRGIPIVTEDFLADGDVSKLEKYVPSLSHGSHTYSAASLRNVIFRSNKTPLLQGASFHLGGLPPKVRNVAREVIIGCGGDTPRRQQQKETVALTEETLDSLYDSVLRGSAP
ncbi:Forkhead-associated (FHA) domain [Trypanosoma melophagium]|uniref:Forkhead-associated (FHA) domain n=1 Tax=Trypanosoma melophagium TaxID=715481 RepID=UPI003519DBBE|nr:Forkhead-associated (FHA) domain [Trypanosoma melophagium]